MAWWTTQFIFQGDTLISEGLDPVFLREVEWLVAATPPSERTHLRPPNWGEGERGSTAAATPGLPTLSPTLRSARKRVGAEQTHADAPTVGAVPAVGTQETQAGSTAQDHAGTSPNRTEPYTRVIVSGYALYGELRGYYALGVAHWHLDRATGRAFLSEAGQRNSEPVSSLTPAQRAIIRECLIRLNLGAWETSNILFRKQLEA